MGRVVRYRILVVLGLFATFVCTARADRELPKPLPNHPGNIFQQGEDVRVPLPPKATGSWTCVDLEGKQIGEPHPASDILELGKLPIGYYELRGPSPTEKVYIGVIAPLVAPTPMTSPIGVDVGMAWFWPDDPTRKAVANICTLAGMNWVRDRMSWPELEPKPGEFSPRNRYDETADIQHDAGLQVLQVNHIGPPWNKNGRRFPDDLRDAYRFYKEMAKRFKGKLVALEPWNEADIDMFGGHTGSEMASMQKASFLGIRAGNPDMIACQNVFAIARPQTLKDFINNDAGPYFDRFDLHHYVNMDRYPEYYALYRSASAGKPMWVTEFNVTVDWSGDEKLQEPDEKNLRIQALRLPKMFAMTLYEGVQAQFYFMLPHYVEGKRQYGLLHRDLSPRPAFLSLAAVGRLLADAKPVGRWHPENPKLHGYVFHAKPDGQEKFVTVLWSSGGDKLIDLNIPTEKIYDEYGRETQGNWIGQVKLQNSPQIAISNVDPSGSLKLDPPPKAPPVSDEKPSPVVLQIMWPDAARDVNHSAYHIPSEEPVTVPLFAYNFSDHAVKGELKVADSGDWKVSMPSGAIELKPNDRHEVSLTITPPAKPTTQPIRITGDFGTDAGKPVVSFDVAPPIQPAK
jgi:hypothetical protein